MKTILAVTALLMSGAAHASTSASWTQMNQRVSRLCLAKSGLTRPRLLDQRASFSDAIGTELRLVRGTDRRGRVQHMLCAYDRATRAVEVQDADGWLGARGTR